MEQQQSTVGKFEKFQWKIENFSRLKTDNVHSETFAIGGYPWKILLYVRGNGYDEDYYISICLEAVKTANMSKGWSRYVKFKLLVFNQFNTNRTITKDYDCEFNASFSCRVFYNFMELDKLNDPNNGFIVEDNCIVGVEICVSKSRHEKQVNQADNLAVSPVSIEPAKKADAELGYAALGRVINFFKTRKVKDMNEQVCKELQVLWDELKKFQFDVTWLEPHVQSALKMKSYVEKVLDAEKLKQNMIVLELEMEKLKEKLVAAELNIDVERDSFNVKGFKEIGLDSELGCLIWRQ